VNADEIMHVLRLTAMGRLNTPAQEEFCEKLARVIADADGFVDVGGGLQVTAVELLNAEPGAVIPATPKRGPGRPKKAE
jgi:hypothetical protein